MNIANASLRIVLLCIVTIALSHAAIGNDGYDMSWHTMDCGGGKSSLLGYDLHGTIGQADAGTMNGGGYTLNGGFWAGSGPSPQPTCPADLNNDGVVDVSDLLILLGAWGPCQGQSCASDISGDTVVDVTDLLMLLGAWGPCQ